VNDQEFVDCLVKKCVENVDDREQAIRADERKRLREGAEERVMEEIEMLNDCRVTNALCKRIVAAIFGEEK
jgi:hypothetical protein